MRYSGYGINLPDEPEAIVFVNGLLARDISGFLWMWKNLVWIRRATVEAKGCVQVKAGVCSPNEVVVVSYWNSREDLKAFFRQESHQQMMQFVIKKPESLCLYNETYSPSHSGKYINEPHGMALIYQPQH